MPPPADIVKVAIEWPGAYPKLMEIDQKKPLSSIIKEVCDGWSLANHDQFALQHADSSNFYITEKNRNEIKNGAILRLTTSPLLQIQTVIMTKLCCPVEFLLSSQLVKGKRSLLSFIIFFSGLIYRVLQS